jgi:hypothetical protein
MRHWLILGSFLLIPAACGGDNSSGDDDTNAADAGSPDADVPAGSYTVTWGPVTVQPGVEDTQCVTVPVGNTETLRVNQIHNVLGDASHHLIVYRVADTTEQSTPYPCDPFTDTLDPAKGSPLMITQKYEETLVLPDGVAFSLEPNQFVRLEMHFINASDSPKEVMATSTFSPIPDAEFEHEADFLFIGDVDIDIPPNSTHTVGPTYFPIPGEFAGSNFFGITGHQHQYGTDVYVATTDGENGTDTPVYDLDNFDWDEPETVYHDPPFQVPGGGGFRFTCQWNNTSDQTLSFGESAGDEMCFFWAYYYPSKGARVCAESSGFQLCCPGNALCDQVF